MSVGRRVCRKEPERRCCCTPPMPIYMRRCPSRRGGLALIPLPVAQLPHQGRNRIAQVHTNRFRRLLADMLENTTVGKVKRIRYHTVEKHGSRGWASFLGKNGQALLPMVELIEQS
jgi:hypothetical protein